MGGSTDGLRFMRTGDHRVGWSPVLHRRCTREPRSNRPDIPRFVGPEVLRSGCAAEPRRFRAREPGPFRSKAHRNRCSAVPRTLGSHGLDRDGRSIGAGQGGSACRSSRLPKRVSDDARSDPRQRRRCPGPRLGRLARHEQDEQAATGQDRERDQADAEDRAIPPQVVCGPRLLLPESGRLLLPRFPRLDRELVTTQASREIIRRRLASRASCGLRRIGRRGTFRLF
jgi:hypothetical protein